MRQAGLAAIMLFAVSGQAAHAAFFDALDCWYSRVEALAQSLIGARTADHEIIKPPEGIDPQMALAPPPIGDRLRIIVPPGEARR